MTISHVTFKFEIDSGGDDTVSAPHEAVAGHLRDAGEEVQAGNNSGDVLDGNGNRIGTWKLSIEQD